VNRTFFRRVFEFDAPPGDPVDPTEEARRRQAALEAEVDRAVEEEISRREAAARSAAIYTIHVAATLKPSELPDTAYRTAKSQLEDLSTARTADNVAGVVNTGFGIGRADGAELLTAQNPDEIAAQVYSAVMDLGTCDECGKWDAATFPYPYTETGGAAVMAPNPRCHGSTKRCRCIWVYITTAEVPSQVPSSKGKISSPFFPFSRAGLTESRV
jgi:hypothetical protein